MSVPVERSLGTGKRKPEPTKPATLGLPSSQVGSDPEGVMILYAKKKKNPGD